MNTVCRFIMQSWSPQIKFRKIMPFLYFKYFSKSINIFSNFRLYTTYLIYVFPAAKHGSVLRMDLQYAFHHNEAKYGTRFRRVYTTLM